MILRSGRCPWRTSRWRPFSVCLSAWPLRKAATSASTACASNARAPSRRTSVSGSENSAGWISLTTLSWVMAYHSFGGEVEARTPPRYAASTPHAVTNFRAYLLAALESHDQGVDTQACLKMLRHRPAHDLARGQILDGREVQKALVGWKVRDVGQPHGVGALGFKGPAQPIGRNRQVMAAVRGLGPASPTSLGLQAHVTHQPLDPTSRMAVPLAAQFSVDARRAIDPPLGRKDPADVPAQLSFRLSAVLSGRDRAQPRVKARDACADDPAQRRNGMVGALSCHKGNLGHAIPRAKKRQLSGGSRLPLRAA